MTEPQKRIWARGFLKPGGILLFLILFFIVYNSYIVNNSLEMLKVSLEETVNAQTATGAEAVNVLLANALLTEVSQVKLDTQTLTALDLASSISGEATSFHQLKGSEFAIKQAIEKKTNQRFFLLRWLDWLNEKVQNFFQFVKETFLWLLRGGMEESPKPVVQYELFEQAKKMEKEGLLEQARDLYRKLVLLNDGAVEIGIFKIRLAFIEMKLGRYQEAKNLLGDVESSRNPVEKKVAYHLRSQIQGLEKVSRAAEKLNAEIPGIKDPEKLQEAYFKLGLMNTELYRLKDSQEAFTKAIDLNPNSMIADKARFHLGFAYKLSANVIESANAFSSMQQMASDDYKTAGAIQLAEIKKATGNFAEAATLLKEISERTKDKVSAALSQYAAGYIYLYNLNDRLGALASMNRVDELLSGQQSRTGVVIEKNPFDATREYAFSMIEKRKYDEAEELFKALIKRDKNDAWSHSGLGTVYELKGNRPAAQEYITHGYVIQPDFYTASALAYLAERAGNLTKAAELNQEAIKDNSDYIYAYYNLGYIYVRQKKFDEAIDVLKKGKELTLKLGTNIPLLQNNLGYSYFYKGKYSEALSMFNEAIRFDPLLVEAWYNRAVLYEKLGEMTKYSGDIKKVYSLNPNYRDVEERASKLAT